MSRATLITGFCAGKGNTERLAEALYSSYEDVEAFTFAQAMKHPDKVRKAARAVPVITHSAGALALSYTSPSEIHALAPPLPASVPALLGRGAVVGARMHTPGIGIHSPNDIAALARFDGSYAREVALHGVANFRQLSAIARFDGVTTAIDAERAGIPTSIMYADGDAFFKLTSDREVEARSAGVHVVRMLGEHNDPLLRPGEFMTDYLAQAA